MKAIAYVSKDMVIEFMKSNNCCGIMITFILISTACFGVVGCNKSAVDKPSADAFKPHPPPADLQKKMEEARQASMQHRPASTH